MAKIIKAAVQRSQDTLLADALGCAALVVLLFAGLYVPGLV